MKQVTTRNLEKRLEKLTRAFRTSTGYFNHELLFAVECEKRWPDGKGEPRFIRAECDRIMDCLRPDYEKLQQQKKLQQQREFQRQKELERREKLQRREALQRQKELERQEKLRKKEELKQV